MESPSPAPRRIAVIGGGITGLAAAHRLGELNASSGSAAAVTLFDSARAPGGLIASERIGDYLIERGADSFLTEKPIGRDLCRRLGLEGDLIETLPKYRRTLILEMARLYHVPAGFQLVAPSRIGPMLRTPLLSCRAKCRTLAELFQRRPSRPQADESLAQFVRRHFGQELLERLAQPLAGGIHTADPEKLSARVALPRFLEMEQRFGSLIRGLKNSSRADADASGSRYRLFVTLREGMQQLLDRLEERIQATGGEIRRGVAVESLQREADGWRVQPTGAAAESFDAVILALPAHAASRLLASDCPSAAAILSGIECASSAIVVTGHGLSDVPHPLDASGLVIPHREQRRILAVSFLSRKFSHRAPDGKVILRTFVGGALQPEEFQRSDSEIITTVLAELESIFGIQRDPEFAVITRYPQAMPQFHVGHLDRIDELRRELSALPRLAVAGNYFASAGVPDCISQGEAAAEAVHGRNSAS